MLKPTDIEQLKGRNSRYAVVLAVAKRARDITDDANASSTILVDKTVSLAIADFTNGDYKIMMPSDSVQE